MITPPQPTKQPQSIAVPATQAILDQASRCTTVADQAYNDAYNAAVTDDANHSSAALDKIRKRYGLEPYLLFGFIPVLGNNLNNIKEAAYEECMAQPLPKQSHRPAPERR